MSGGIGSLATLGVGEKGRVKPFVATHFTAQRLLAMGLLPGTEITVVQVAPLGDPVEIEFRGMRLSLRKSDATTVDVERL